LHIHPSTHPHNNNNNNSLTSRVPSYGDKKSNSLTVSVILGLTGKVVFSIFFLKKINFFKKTNSMKEHANNTISDEVFVKRHERWSLDTPDTKEAYLIREIFNGKKKYIIHPLSRIPSDLFCFCFFFCDRPFPFKRGRTDCSSVSRLIPFFSGFFIQHFFSKKNK